MSPYRRSYSLFSHWIYIIIWWLLMNLIIGQTFLLTGFFVSFGANLTLEEVFNAYYLKEIVSFFEALN
jgi:hypothetical protein